MIEVGAIGMLKVLVDIVILVLIFGIFYLITFAILNWRR